ncbi:hypothetical protein IKE88_02925 [Candidatus Saccharibacteria bacterium]|nr:hypothetical protein [Candidatus Saccharibacteria bacterium]
MPNPTDPDAGTNRTNAVSRDNLMNGASLGYDGAYVATLLDAVGRSGFWWSSAINTSRGSIFMKVHDTGIINPRDDNNKYPGRAVRCANQT